MAAPKRVDPLKAKEAKQKKIAIGGMAVLCLLLFIQGPKTLKMLKGPEPTPAAAPAVPNPVAPAPGATAPAAGSVGAAAPGDVVDLSALADSDVAPVAEEGHLVSFERFASKDPFVPQAVAASAPAPAAPADDAQGEGAGGATPGEADPVDGGFTPAPAEGSGGGTSGGASAPAAPALAADTSISVNGTAEDVEEEAAFPADEPTFMLVSLAKDGKSVEIGIAGGTYANGGQTIELEVGKPLTLQNTADGTRYELELLAVAGFPVPKQKR
ncbi:MAG TPA: hypothetical protein VNP93_08080 [Gaiellaceae bacterium]|nr:hypothetical protein [Gaiellaceae bacterium]